MGNTPLQCCIPDRSYRGGNDEHGGQQKGTNKVELAATQLFKVPGLAAAYHTSIIVSGEEFFFSDSGIIADTQLVSHAGNPTERRELGYTSVPGGQLYWALQSHFRPGTYDLVRKNCNSFSDCAVHYLLGKRLDRKYSVMERMGQVNPSLLHSTTKGVYVPNPAAADFSVDSVIKALDKEKKLHGGASSSSGRRQGSTSSYARPPSSFSAGSEVVVTGLAANAELNGVTARIVRFNPVNGRWEAALESGDVKAFRAENLRPAGLLRLDVGDKVRVHGLQTEAGRQLNGSVGKVVRYLQESQRYEVRLESDDTKAFKAENLEKPDA